MDETARKSILEMAKVIDNILDPNTRTDLKRKLIVTLEFLPDKSRSNIAVTLATKLALAEANPLTTNLCVMNNDDSNELRIVEIVPLRPGQLDASPAQLDIRTSV